MVDFLMNGLVAWLATRVADLLGVLHAFLTSAVFLSPDVTALPQVTEIATTSAYIVDTCYVLAIIAAGITVMASTEVQLRYRVKELAPRLVVAAVLSAFAVPLCSQLIQVANALTTAMAGPATPTDQVVTMTQSHIRAAIVDPATALLAVVIGVLIVVLLVGVLLGWISRVALLVILAGVAPAAMACYCLPALQPAAELWWRSLLGCLGTAVLQAVTFTTGMRLLVDPDANLPVLLGLPGTDLVNLLIVIVVLVMTVKIPGLVRRHVTGRGGPNAAGRVARTVVVQTVIRRLPFIH
ncbi:putative membrane protein [Allocatelliglobosispora scoriae]|uniref:Putative membrane protein n=1 Tax=Allocatelliglobosispora scoriae TaxID=643052 RepID=A0A841C745_9ACTN|nr:hypothetical protein [Allocatelliglobosispora scoriae]MBB5874611.1 putative membrane protein [Allocatelliglobosispora scoriae]